MQIPCSVNGRLPRMWIARFLTHIAETNPWLAESWLEDCPALDLLGELSEQLDEITPKALRARLDDLSSGPPKGVCRGTIEENIRRFGKEVGLKRVEVDLLVFAKVFASEHEFAETVLQGWQKFLDPMPVEKVLSVMLRVKPGAVRKALGVEGLLRRSGLLAPEEYACRDDCFPIEFAVLELGPAFAEIFDPDFSRRAAASAPLMLRCEAQPSAEKFSNIGRDLELMENHLNSWTGEAPSQVLLWGSETRVLREFAGVVSETCGRAPFMANPKAGFGGKGARDAEQTLVALRYCEALANQQNKPSVLICCFPSSYSCEGEVLLEEARSRAIPTLWLLESVEDLSLTQIAGFDLALRVELDWNAQAKRSFESLPYATDKLDDANLEPKHRRRLAQAVAMFQASDPADDYTVEQFFDRAVSNAAQLQEACMGSSSRRSEQRQKSRPRPQSQYDPSLINADVDLNRILASAERQQELRILLCGPPGTGKTEFAKQLAVRAGRELVIERASDLLSCWVGESEKNIAKAFENAQGKVLLIDEIDGLLFARDNARRNHERSQVGEMLTSMEDFRGILVATTNDRGCLDKASERRFDVKAELDYLTLAQKLNRAMTVLPECAQNGKESLRKQLSATLEELLLTPDDFERVKRNAGVFGEAITPSFLLDFLRSEASGRAVDRNSRGIGFFAEI